MKIETYYNKSSRTWVAYAFDKNGDQIGHSVDASEKEQAIFWLGVELADQHRKQLSY